MIRYWTVSFCKRSELVAEGLIKAARICAARGLREGTIGCPIRTKRITNTIKRGDKKRIETEIEEIQPMALSVEAKVKAKSKAEGVSIHD